MILVHIPLPDTSSRGRSGSYQAALEEAGCTLFQALEFGKILKDLCENQRFLRFLSLHSGTVSQTSKAQRFRRFRHTPLPSSAFVKCSRTKLT